VIIYLERGADMHMVQLMPLYIFIRLTGLQTQDYTPNTQKRST